MHNLGFIFLGPISLRNIYIISLSVLLRTGTATPNLVHTEIYIMDLFRSNFTFFIVLHKRILYTAFEFKQEYKFTMSKEEYLYKYLENVLDITLNTVFV